MTDLWDTLWGFWDAGKVDPFALETCFPDFIKKIRAEGNDLKEKAEKWDQFFEKPEARVRAVEILLEKGKKLEAVKTHLNAVYKDESDHFPWSINPMAFNKLMRNLYKILEGEQTSEVKTQ